MSEIYRVDVEITAPVYDTEVTSRVADAVANIFPTADLEEGFGEIRGEAHSMDHVSELLHKQEILDTARGEFFATREGDTFSFALKKQAAFEDRINFSVGEPDELGEISVRVRVDDPTVEEYIDHVAPPTEDGRPIDV
ncbi:RNA-binding domain-containing protein [Halosolutus gelatinilyticus]|uniref:RNA-binding domain-containing protein n=1 Tax=Halosolutus gelatinilyticus TaxID=2931975 RepID=UPI001FF59C33|nr:RNA-binding domain-containing protein [Halosolutus gelatinilyticus]